MRLFVKRKLASTQTAFVIGYLIVVVAVQVNIYSDFPVTFSNPDMISIRTDHMNISPSLEGLGINFTRVTAVIFIRL